MPFFLLGSLLIDERDIEAADWTGRRPFVFACAAVILAIPFIGGACSANGFRSQIGSGVYFAAAPPALFLAASKARFHLIGPRGMKSLILVSTFVGLVPGAIYQLVTNPPSSKFYLPGQPAANIAAVYLSCVAVIILYLTSGFERRARFLAYLVVFALLALGLLTESRTFLASTAIALCIYTFTVRHKKVLLHEMLTVIAMIVAILVASFFTFRSGFTRLLTEQSSNFFDGRLQTWSDGWALFRRYPLCGIGPHTFYNQQLNPLYIERDKLGISYYPFYHAHNIFLNTLAEGGIITGILLLVLIAAAIYGCYAILRDDPGNQFGLLAVALMAMLPDCRPVRKHACPPGGLLPRHLPGARHERHLEKTRAGTEGGMKRAFSAIAARR